MNTSTQWQQANDYFFLDKLHENIEYFMEHWSDIGDWCLWVLWHLAVTSLFEKYQLSVGVMAMYMKQKSI